jgi:uncharacterized coiled-coil DUF342 family protein
MNIETIINTLKQELETTKKNYNRIQEALDTIVEVLPEFDISDCNKYNDLIETHSATKELSKLVDNYSYTITKLRTAISELAEIRDLK